jgi:hypothetical protein
MPEVAWSARFDMKAYELVLANGGWSSQTPLADEVRVTIEYGGDNPITNRFDFGSYRLEVEAFYARHSDRTAWIRYTLHQPGNPFDDETLGVSRGSFTRGQFDADGDDDEVFYYWFFYANISDGRKLWVRFQRFPADFGLAALAIGKYSPDER